MADPLSISASVAGLISLGLQTIEYLYKYYAAYRDRNRDLARTAEKLDDLLQSLHIIDDIVRTRKWRSNEDHILQHIEESITRCDEVVSELQDEAQKCKKVPGDTLKGNLKEIGRKAAYPFRESTLKKLDEDINDFRDNLSTALQALELKEHSNTQDDIEELKCIVQHAQAQRLAMDIRDWLKAPDASIDFNSACSKRYAGTGQWFIHSDTFTTWLEQKCSFRWLYGFAGCGKSVLCATTIQYTFRRRSSNSGSAVAFFFFTFNDRSKQDASAMLRALLSQLSGQISGLDSDLARLKDSSNHSTPPISVLMEYLQQAISRTRHVYILLDALDESPIDSARTELLAAIQTMREWSLPGLHLFVTSRDLPDIRDSVRHYEHDEDQYHIALRDQGVQEDIQEYVSYQVDHDPQLRRWGEHREKIKESLTQRANGVFRWVDCQLHPLRHCPRSVKYLKQCLSTLPESLDATYERMLCSIDHELWDDAQRILSVLCLSPRPLSDQEVMETLTVDLDMECYDSDRKLECVNDLHRICPGLIEAIPHHRDKYQRSEFRYNRDENGDINLSIVRIAHFSVQEYLVSDRIKQSSARDFAVSQSTQHLQISKICLLYLCNDALLQHTFAPDLIQEFPLAPFAAQYWSYHYQQTDTKFAGQLSEKVSSLFTWKKWLNHCVLLYDPDEAQDEVNYDRKIETLATPIYYASILGLDQIVVGMLSEPESQVNARGGLYNTALQAASFKGHGEVVKTLLRAGADVNAIGGYLVTALHAASFRGHEEVVQILLNTGANVDIRDREFGSPLVAAAVGGNENVTKILLNAGADVNTQGRKLGTALQAASLRGYANMTKMLLYAGADVNTQGDFGTALQVASYSGHEDVVKVLLNSRADVNAGEGYRNTALQAASDEGHEEVLKMLLYAGANVNARGRYHNTALHAASYRGYENIVKILLDKGADINARGGEYDTTLQAAAYKGHMEVVKILLDAGADVRAQGGGEYDTALQAASSRGHDDVVKTLLKAGADVDAQGGHFGSALQAASRIKSEEKKVEMVKILLDAGAKEIDEDGVDAQRREQEHARECIWLDDEM